MCYNMNNVVGGKDEMRRNGSRMGICNFKVTNFSGTLFNWFYLNITKVILNLKSKSFTSDTE